MSLTKKDKDHAYKCLIHAEAEGLGDKCDAVLYAKSRPLINFCKDKFGLSFHTTAALISLGLMPCIDAMSMKETIAFFNKHARVKLNNKYITAMVYKRIREQYGIKKCKGFPQIVSSAKSKPKIREVKPQEEIYEVCVFCNSHFRIRDDGIHCICLSCSVNGASVSQQVENRCFV